MSLHVPTMFAALLLAFALFGVALSFARQSLLHRAELRTWARGTWLLVGGFLMLASRAALPDSVAVLFGNGLVFLALYTLHRALHRFIAGARLPWGPAAVVVLGWTLLLVTVSWAVERRTPLISALLVVQLVPMVTLVLRRGWHAEPSLRMVGAILGLTALALAARTVHALLHPEQYTGFFQASLGNGLTYLVSFLFPLGAGFGFVLANLERLAGRLNELAMRDALTGCINRGVFEEMLQHALEHSRRAGEPVSLLLLDLDHFKQVNDTYGHQAGDAVLRAAADEMRGRLRAADVLGRLGGEEFGVVLPATDAAGAARAAEDLRAALESLQVTLAEGGQSVHVTASFGICSLPPGSPLKSAAMLSQADRALYEAKHAGRNRVVVRVAGDAAVSSKDGGPLAAKESRA